MLIINKDSVNAVKQKLGDVGKTREAIDDLRRMLEIKQTLLWRSEAMAPCCGSLCSIASHLACEVGILENTLTALENSDRSRAADLLEEYLRVLEANREPSEPNYR